MDSTRGLSKAEVVAVQALRERIDDLLPRLNKYLSHDLGLVRFLRARELNLDKAEDMLRKNLQWKADNGINNIHNTQLLPEVQEEYPIKISGFSKKDHIVAYAHVGKWDLRKTMESGKKDQFLLFVKKVLEFAMSNLAKLSTPDRYVSQIHAILNFEGFSFAQVMSKEVIEATCEGIRIFEANYPEILGKCVVINAPKIFQILWAVVKPMLSARTLEKIVIYGSNKDTWKKSLLSDIDPDNLVSECGGGITTCMPLTFKQGFPIFPNYIDHSQEEMKTRFIQPGQKYDVELYMKGGSKLSWNFKTEGCDIGFRVDFDGSQPVIQEHRVDSQQVTQKGCVICEESGKYTLTFDNSFSTFRGKTLKYVIQTYDKAHDLNGNDYNQIISVG